MHLILNLVPSLENRNMWEFWKSNSFIDLFLFSEKVFQRLNLKTSVSGTGEGPRANPCAFWNEFIPMLRQENRTGWSLSFYL